MKKLYLIAAVLAALLIGSAAFAEDAPDFELDALDGNEYSIDDLLEENKLLIIDFWQVGCKPCNELLPHLDEINQEFGEDGVEVVIISRDTALTLPYVEPYFVANDFSFKVLLDSELDVSNELGVKASPATFFVTPDKSIIWSHFGFKSGQESEIYEVVELYLEGGDVSEIELEEGDTSG